MNRTETGRPGALSEENILLKDNLKVAELKQSTIYDFQNLLRTGKLEEVGELLIEGTYGEIDFMKKDTIDRFLDYIYSKCVTGYMEIPSLAFPVKRMMDRELEARVIELINVHLYPEIILRLMKFFTRNLHDSDSNLHIANLITSKELVRSVYETYRLFLNDIFISDRNKRCRNVRMMQQFSTRSDIRLSSPLDAAARLKYILEFFLLKLRVTDIYTQSDLEMAKVIPAFELRGFMRGYIGRR